MRGRAFSRAVLVPIPISRFRRRRFVWGVRHAFRRHPLLSRGVSFRPFRFVASAALGVGHDGARRLTGRLSSLPQENTKKTVVSQ